MTITKFIEFHAKVRPDSPMLVQDEQRLTYAEAIKDAQQLAGWLQAIGITAGERVAILGENSIDHVRLLLAASYVGAVMVPLNYRLAAPELAAVIDDAQAVLLLISDTEMSHLKQTLIPLLKPTVRLVDNLCHAPVNIDQAVNRDSDGDEAVFQLYTSGTTGTPKGVLISHNNVESLAVGSWAMYRSKPGVGTVDLVVAPLFHIGGLGSLLIPILAGGTVVLHRQFVPDKIVADVETLGVNTLFMVPAMIQALLSTVADIKQRNFSALKQITYGASPISPSLLQEAIDVFQCDFYQLYGMTETTGAIVSLTPEDHEKALLGQIELLQSCGRGNVGVDIKICDEAGQALPVGETGEVVIFSAANTKGYWQRPDETSATVRDGWIYTGDAGYLDSEGYLYIRDRMKDMVISGGENIYPVEVEKVLAGHPAILEVAVIGVAHTQYGEALLAIVVLNEGAGLKAEELVSFCRDKIAGYKIPRQLTLVDALPRNPSGKVLKTQLRSLYGG